MSLNHQSSDEQKDKEQRNNNNDGYGKRAKRLVKKVKKQFQRNKVQKEVSWGLCCWCVGGLPSHESGTESPTSDPNSSGFGFDSLRGLIEKSDFLLDECNTHLDVYISDDCYDDIYYDDDDYDHVVVINDKDY